MSKPGRNEPCHCGSGKKYKKCCLQKDESEALQYDIEEKKPTYISDDEWEDENTSSFNDDMDADDELINDELSDDESGEYSENDPSYIYKDEIEKYSKKVDEEYPILNKEDEKKVDDWWARYKIMKDPVVIKQHLEDFLATNSIELIINLGLEHEVLFELIGDFVNKGKKDEIMNFMIDFRKKYPEVYHRSAGYYDFDIIAWLLTKNRTKEIPEYLNFFEEYPVNYVDKLFETIDLLLSTNNSILIAQVVTKIYKAIWYSREVFGGYEIADIPVYQIINKYLKHNIEANDLNNLIDNLKNLGLDFESHYLDQSYWQKRFNMYFRQFEPWDIKIPKKKSQYYELIFIISENFTRYLKEIKNIDLISANYYSRLYEKYCSAAFKKNKPKSLFNFTKNQMDEIIASMSSDMMWIRSTISFPLCNMLYYFVEYLFMCGNYNEIEKERMQHSVKELYNLLFKSLKRKNIEADVYEKFPFFD